ncbi:hypothetical protein S40293_11534 [Stachybotrys chartarum IBT 40293]|nr:hypothetical protein S40293_11534 [Stachybotrys chartarum IBT 40293]
MHGKNRKPNQIAGFGRRTPHHPGQHWPVLYGHGETLKQFVQAARLSESVSYPLGLNSSDFTEELNDRSQSEAVDPADGSHGNAGPEGGMVDDEANADDDRHEVASGRGETERDGLGGPPA